MTTLQEIKDQLTKLEGLNKKYEELESDKIAVSKFLSMQRSMQSEIKTEVGKLDDLLDSYKNSAPFSTLSDEMQAQITRVKSKAKYLEQKTQEVKTEIDKKLTEGHITMETTKIDQNSSRTVIKCATESDRQKVISSLKDVAKLYKCKLTEISEGNYKIEIPKGVSPEQLNATLQEKIKNKGIKINEVEPTHTPSRPSF